MGVLGQDFSSAFFWAYQTDSLPAKGRLEREFELFRKKVEVYNLLKENKKEDFDFLMEICEGSILRAVTNNMIIPHNIKPMPWEPNARIDERGIYSARITRADPEILIAASKVKSLEELDFAEATNIPDEIALITSLKIIQAHPYGVNSLKVSPKILDLPNLERCYIDKKYFHKSSKYLFDELKKKGVEGGF